MKILLIITSVLLSLNSYVFAASNAELEKRIALLESKFVKLKESKLSDCVIKFKYHTTVTNSCPQNTVIREVFLLGAQGPIQVSCYYYQLQCKVNGVFQKPHSIYISDED